MFVLGVLVGLWGVLISFRLWWRRQWRLGREMHEPPLCCELSLNYAKQPKHVNMFRLDLKMHCLQTGRGIDFFFLWHVIYCQCDRCPVITHPDSFKHATINTFIMAMRTQWQGSVLVINLRRIISWIRRSLRLKWGFIGSLSSLAGRRIWQKCQKDKRKIIFSGNCR